MQQINLYLPEFRPQKDILSINQLLLVLVTAVLIFAGLGWYLDNQTELMKLQIAREERMLEPLRIQKAELDKVVSARPDWEGLDNLLLNAQTNIQNKSLALQTLKTSDIGAGKGFSEFLRQLAKQSERRIWLTDIKMESDILALKGQTVDPKLISIWIDNVVQKSTMARQFSAVSITQNETDQRVFDFELKDGVLLNDE
ncbi:PilN domain-containing protein [Pleionea sediminis]|uniref:PilN domain-containing protein n=1 Tax=Pleionea sediminis TaxID=2569479 RepID=UPI00118713F3|nr:PilN domain-containing protein [Pleionea sediminis]